MKNYFILIFSLTITFCSLDSDSSNISDETILPDEEISNDSTSVTPNDEENSTTSSLDNRKIIYFIAESVSNDHQETVSYTHLTLPTIYSV